MQGSKSGNTIGMVDGNEEMENEWWGYDYVTGNEVNLMTHCKTGGIGYDENWNIIDNNAIMVIVSKGKTKGNTATATTTPTINVEDDAPTHQRDFRQLRTIANAQ